MHHNTCLVIIAAALAARVGADTSLEYSAGWGETIDEPGVNPSWVNLQFQTSVANAISAYSKYRVPSLYALLD